MAVGAAAYMSCSAMTGEYDAFITTTREKPNWDKEKHVWSTGNQKNGTFGGNLTADTLRPIFEAGMANGLNLWNTACAYGMGTSEKVLAGFLKGLPWESYLVSDKFTPQCASDSPTAMADMIEMQLKLMDLDRFDIYWIHNVWNAPHWTEELARYYEGNDNVPMLGKLEILNAAMKKLADKNHVAIAQIPVAWAIAKGTLPIIGVTKENQVLDAAKAASITLTAEETAELESVADSLELNVIRFWEKEMR